MSCPPQSSFQVQFASLGGYILGKTLGKGYNSKVKLGYDPSTDQYYAVKIIKHSDADLNMRILQKEIDILSKLKHTNIVNMVEFNKSVDYVKKNGASYKVVAIVMELVSGGEVFDYVKVTGKFSEEIARIYFKILIETLEHCHQEGIAHRDLKLENLLFDENFNMKIADFGFATSLTGKNGNGQLKTYLGTESYMAPEIILRKAYKGEAVDIFACGIILFIMVSGIPPFLKADPKTDRYYRHIYRKEFNEFWDVHERHRAHETHGEQFYSEEFRDLINAMFAYKPSDRPSIEQIKNHPWFNGTLPNIDELKNEFAERKERVEAEIQRQREEKKEEKLRAQMEAEYDPETSYTGFRPYC